jgi:flavin reductase (DIM6/NTAB) family NADH-FMN oxidoreductase RutF
MSSKGEPAGAAPVSARQFCTACGRFATGVAVAGATAPDGRSYGITVNSFTSVSLAPPLVLICIGSEAPIMEHFRRSKYFSISVLDEGQRFLSEHFACSGPTPFEGFEWHAGATGAPLVARALAAIECVRVRIQTAGDHDILIGEVIHTSVREGRPLLYFASRYRTLDVTGESP